MASMDSPFGLFQLPSGVSARPGLLFDPLSSNNVPLRVKPGVVLGPVIWPFKSLDLRSVLVTEAVIMNVGV